MSYIQPSEPSPSQAAVTGTVAAPGETWLGRHRRWLIIAGVLAPMILFAAVVAVSWYYSAAVVVPDHGGLPADITVDAVSSDQVVLARSEDSARPGVYGLDWQAGHAIIGAILRSDGRTVTRQLRSLVGYLAGGMKVSLDGDVYAGNPAQALGLPSQTVQVPDELGPMPAWFIAGRKDTWAIVVHGINRDPQAGLRIAPVLHRLGLATLLISYREDLGVPPSPDGLHHMGLTEWRDLAAAATYALSHGARRLVLVGYSMGGAIVSQFMERSPLARRVAGLVLDSPALDWRSILAYNATELGLPSFAAAPVEWMIGLRIHPDWESLDVLHHTSSFHVPILLFHGTADKLVPISTSDTFARKLGGWVTYYRVSGAQHAQTWNRNPGLYDQRLTSFLRRIVP